MTIKIASFMVVALMMLAGVLVILPASTNAMPTENDDSSSSAEVAYEPTAMTLDQDELNTLADSAVVLDGQATATVMTDTVAGSDPIGTVKTYATYDTWYNGFWTHKQIEKRGEGTYCEVWVSTDMSFPGGDSRNDYTSRLTINASQVSYIIDQFDDNIYAKMSSAFGVPVARNGSAADTDTIEYWGTDYFNVTDGGKVMIVIENIKDQTYYQPAYPYYVVGFFMSSVDDIYDRNIIHIDCWDWANRTGDQSATNPARSYLYEATVAHEYQHLIHNGIDPMEENFINEGCSDYAELVCGYGQLSLASHIGNFLNQPTNSLTIWGDGDQLADYGAAVLFTIYLHDKFGGDAMIKALVYNNLTGIASVTDTLEKQGYAGWTFNKVFNQWRIANLLDSNQPGNGKYKYDTLNLADMGVMYTKTLPMNSWSGLQYVGTYGTDYVDVERGYMRLRERLNNYVYFQGLDTDIFAGWQNEGDLWWSNAVDSCDYSLQGSIDLRDTGSTSHYLTIDTEYYIEEGWDYGFVQVSTDGGLTWVSLANDYTYDINATGAMGSIVEQLPGITGEYDGGYISWDLSAYDEQFIEVRFRYMTDWASTYDGWAIWDIYVDGDWYDGPEDQYYFAPVYESADWMMTIVLYHNDRPIGVVDVQNNVNYGPTSASPGYYYYDWEYMQYRAFRLRSVTSICVVSSPQAELASLYGIFVGVD